MAEYRPEMDLKIVFKPAKLMPDDMRYSIWASVFTTTIGSEGEFNKDITGRLKETFGDGVVLPEYVLSNGCRVDGIILESVGGVPRVVLEYKKPPAAEGGSRAQKLSLLLHSAQAINYTSQVMFEHPEIGILPVIITDGRSFVAGYGKRESLGSLVIVLCDKQFSLYADGGMGADFELFWSMCNYAGPKRSLEVVIREEPRMVVRVNKCIGHGASSFVYEASLANEPAVKDQVYSNLKKLKTFAIKITKVGHADSWTTETDIFEELKKKQAYNCGLFPILSGRVPGLFWIIYPLGVPVAPTVDTKAGVKSLLKLRHFAGLLDDLCAIHQAGFVHRDVRLANILMVGDEAKLIDFGYATAPTDSMQLLGTQSTASQAILAAAFRGQPIFYRPEDDLESLLKVYILHRGDFDIECGEGALGCMAAYDKWIVHVEPALFKKKTYAERVDYLQDLFKRDEETAWEVEYFSDRAMPK